MEHVYCLALTDCGGKSTMQVIDYDVSYVKQVLSWYNDDHGEKAGSYCRQYRV